MIFGRRSARRATSSFIAAVALAAATLLPALASAQGDVKLYQRPVTLGGRLDATILVVGWLKDSADVERLIDMVSAKMNEAFMNLDYMNASGDVGRLNAAGQGAQQVSQDTVAAFEEAKKVGDWTGGWFDVAAYGAGSYRDIKADGKNAVELKKGGMQVRFDGMLEGFLAELGVRMLSAANMQNSLVKVGNVFRGIGMGPAGPWKIQVQDDSGTYARHALNLTVSNTGVATISASEYRAKELISPKSKSAIDAPVRGVTIVMPNSAHAQGVAKAAFTAGPSEGMKILTKTAKASGLIVDNEGKFLRTPGF